MTAIVIDDEPIALEIIRSLSRKVAFIEFKAYFANAFEAVDFLQKNKVDLLFLDIKMPDISGIEFLQSLASPPMVIFTTAYSEHAVQSFELDAIDYLLKPFSLSRFLKACTKAHEQYELRKNNIITPPVTSSIFIKSGYEQIRVALDEIWYVESSGNYMKFVLEKQKIASRLTMSEAEALLPASDFIRIHRSFIVAKKQVSKVDRHSVWIRQTELPIGAAYAHEIETIFQ
ncbi:LytTR family DNA-binding domain-containing protein [Cytophagaceae bacterium NT2B1]|nr:LytTR family DNA-binding domain-containing protein [Xanthocytophaga flavus]